MVSCILQGAPSDPVLRASRLRKSTPGEEWSAQERTSHERDTIQLLRRRAGNKPALKKAKIAADTEHLASFDFMASLADVLCLMASQGLDGWFVEGPLDLNTVPRSLILTMDFQQTQWRVLWFLRHWVGLNIEGVLELVHRRNNDLGLAIIEADFGTVRDRGFICANVHFGPLPHGGNHAELRDVALDLSTNACPDDPELMFFWPKIKHELKLPVESDNREGRQAFLHGLPEMRNIKTHGVKASNGKWGSLQEAWTKGMDQFIGTDLYVMTHLGKRKRWLPNGIQDLYPVSSACDQLIRHGSAALLPAAVAASLGPTGKAAAKAKTGAVPAGKAKAKPTRKSSRM